MGGLVHELGLSGVGELRTQLGRVWRRKLARLLDPDEVTERDFWQIVGEARSCMEGGRNQRLHLIALRAAAYASRAAPTPRHH
jgi:hypothetical protein